MIALLLGLILFTVLYQHATYGTVYLLKIHSHLRMRAQPLLRRTERHLATDNGKHLPANETLAIADHQDLGGTNNS